MKHRATFRQRLALHDFVCRAFHAESVRELLDRLTRATGADGALDSEARVESLRHPNGRLPPKLALHDGNIQRHERRLRLTAEHSRSLKPHQYLALLFTEYYLDRYFSEPAQLLVELNDRLGTSFRGLPPYEPSDLETLAFQSATGSGKTLLMHVHIEQFRHYAERGGRRVRSVILLTPNERMSEQHRREMDVSGLRSRLFSPDAPRELFRTVEIFDINKLAERKGIKRVAVSEFGADNLVLVDEGHLGASGQAWRRYRKELGRGGFTFEYSATFDQIVGKAPELLDAYAKSVLFDYPYRDFHEDGYGKDYSIVNLKEGVQDPNSDLYLLGCLLTFYRQFHIWQTHGRAWREYHVTRPLWAFLGKTVLGPSKTKDAATTRSDVLLILGFFGRFLAERERMVAMIGSLLAGESGLHSEAGGDWFAGRLEDLAQDSPPKIYDDVCKALFYGTGKLHVEYLTRGEGELHLRVADNPVFGVVNVGDAAGLHARLQATADPHFVLERNLVTAPMFADVDRETSPVNIVVGARRFIAGWNSWRVSTIGLMHVGVGEGPEIVQMFGRGVRLKGWNLSLKRHGPAGASPGDGADQLAEIETLHIFGLRANYMDVFRRLLQDQGLDFETATVELPVTWNFGRVPDLQILRLPPGRFFERSGERLAPPDPAEEGRPVIRRNLYSALEIEASRPESEPGSDEAPQSGSLVRFARLFNEGRIHERVMAKKQRQGWWNLEVELSLVRRLLGRGDWYDLLVPREQLEVRSFSDLQRLEELAGDMVLEYFERSWRRERSRWEATQLEARPLAEDDDNRVGKYEVTGRGTVDAALVRDLEGLTGMELHRALEKFQIEPFWMKEHAYEPLLWSTATVDGERTVEVHPVPLNRDEKRVVDLLRQLAEEDSVLGDRQLFLIRNRSRGRGVSFFDNFGYFPDFIVWLRRGDTQHILFLDPKGLGRYGRREREKIALHRRIKDIEAQLRERRGATKPELFLHAYVLSTTPARQIDEGRFSEADWRRDGVFFLNRRDCVRDLIAHALSSNPGRAA
ncbi:MAG: hypothetical protein F4Z12_03195 [Acidobacteria bacterium]|nr:hypothetical protein [Acidobacteriota bacterium]MYE94520.1 hypothetical protein [Gemmatimonadota bacterium]MYJ12205.1 hypothetical protein [Gemmatimonadota bacterium]